jgi:hypothetical protein
MYSQTKFPSKLTMKLASRMGPRSLITSWWTTEVERDPISPRHPFLTKWMYYWIVYWSSRLGNDFKWYYKWYYSPLVGLQRFIVSKKGKKSEVNARLLHVCYCRSAFGAKQIMPRPPKIQRWWSVGRPRGALGESPREEAGTGINNGYELQYDKESYLACPAEQFTS